MDAAARQLRRHLRRRARRQEPAHGAGLRRPLQGPWPILIGITVATALVHLVSVSLVGAVLGAALPTEAISIVAGLAFLGFAAWTLRGDELDDDEAAKATRTARSAVLAAGVAFFLAELGDKTMLATITLATNARAPGHLARLDGRHGRRRRPGHRRRPAARHAAAGTGRQDRRRGLVRRLRLDPARRGPPLTLPRAVGTLPNASPIHLSSGRRSWSAGRQISAIARTRSGYFSSPVAVAIVAALPASVDLGRRLGCAHVGSVAG